MTFFACHTMSEISDRQSFGRMSTVQGGWGEGMNSTYFMEAPGDISQKCAEQICL